MHIPDGYLSPATCATLYAGSVPFWWVALRRIKRELHTRLIPLISLFSAFCFLIMMFNLPLPGGTTGHALGVGLATVMLGPWAAMISLSVAIIIQALFFGDGGISAIGANCFNMAIAGSLVAYAINWLIAGRSPTTSFRRVVAAGLAGYAAVNVAALLAAIEFGIQPLFYRDAAGAPLYCPYPLSVSIPAMMLGHLTVAGAAELVVSAGLVAFLQRSDISLFALSPNQVVPAIAPPPRWWRGWAVIGLLVILTPVGIFAVGPAWGEWSVSDFVNHTVSAAGFSGHVPAGLREMSTQFWTSPWAHYAPSFIQSTSIGYFLSALIGTALVIAFCFLMTRALLASNAASMPMQNGDSSPSNSRRRTRRRFVENTMLDLHGALDRALHADHAAHKKGLLQRLDPRVKVAGIAALLLTSALAAKVWTVAAVLIIAISLAIVSRAPLQILAKRLWLATFVFSAALAIPALFLTQGNAIFSVPGLRWNVTAQGLTTCSLLILRAESAATLTLVLVFTTPWMHVLKALRMFRVPAVFVVILGMTCRYLLLLLENAREMFESRRSRMVGMMTKSDERRLAILSAGALLQRTMRLSGDVYLAMQARGFRGEVYLLDEFRMTGLDWFALTAFGSVATVLAWVGR